MAESDIARLRERIALEYESPKRVFTDFTPTAQHEYITKRQENIAACFQDLTKIMPPEEAIAIVIQAENSICGVSSSPGNTS